MESLDPEAEALATFWDAAALFKRVLKDTGTVGRDGMSGVLSTRQKVDSALSSLLDDLAFELVIETETARETNAETIQRLLDNEVSQILVIGSTEVAVKDFAATVLEAAFAPDLPTLGAIEGRLETAVLALEESLPNVPQTGLGGV